jgi:hypothetical protein
MCFTGRRHCSERRKKSFRHNTLEERREARPCEGRGDGLGGAARAGFARCSETNDGVIELTPSSGEVFLLGKTSIRRISADYDEAGRVYQLEAGFRFEVGHHSEMKPATIPI